MSVASSAELLSRTDLQQGVYRKLLSAFGYPGSVNDLVFQAGGDLQESNGHLDAANLVLVTLVDENARLADPEGLVTEDMRVLIGCQMTEIDDADFVVSRGHQCQLSGRSPKLGDLDHPHLGATIVLVCDEIGSGTTELIVSGPGVRGRTQINISGLDPCWLTAREGWVEKFPTGVDLLLCDAQRVVGLPRTSQIAFTSVR